MSTPINVKITIAIIAAIGVGFGSFVFGLSLNRVHAINAILLSIGAGLFFAGLAAMSAQQGGAFRDLRASDSGGKALLDSGGTGYPFANDRLPCSKLPTHRRKA